MIDKYATEKAVAHIICDHNLIEFGPCRKCYKKAEKVMALLREGVVLSRYD